MVEKRDYNEMEAKALLAEAGVPAAPERLAHSGDDAAKGGV